MSLCPCSVWCPPGLWHCQLRCEERVWPSPRLALWLRPSQQQHHEDRSYLWVRRMFRCGKLKHVGICTGPIILKYTKTGYLTLEVFVILVVWCFQTGPGLRWLQQGRCPFSASPCHGRLQIQHGGMDECFLLSTGLTLKNTLANVAKPRRM